MATWLRDEIIEPAFAPNSPVHHLGEILPHWGWETWAVVVAIVALVSALYEAASRVDAVELSSVNPAIVDSSGRPIQSSQPPLPNAYIAPLMTTIILLAGFGALYHYNPRISGAFSSHMSDRELADAAHKLASEMRDFESQEDEKEQEIDSNSPIPFEQKRREWLDTSNEKALIFQDKYLGRAVYLRNQLLSRLPFQPTPPPRGAATDPEAEMEQIEANTAFSGSIAGAHPISAAADYLDRLANEIATPEQ